MRCYEVAIRGKDKEVREDSGFHNEQLGIYLVADGCSGLGPVYASMAVTSYVGKDLECFLEENKTASQEELQEVMRKAIDRANDKIIGKGHTTLDLAVIKDQTLYGRSIGDGQVCLFYSDGKVEVVLPRPWSDREIPTNDNDKGPGAYLGDRESLNYLKEYNKSLEGVAFVLMLTDGFIDMVSQEEVEALFREKKNAHPDDFLAALVERRNNPQEKLRRFFEKQIPFDEKRRLQKRYFSQSKVDYQHLEFRKELLSPVKWDDSLAYLIDLEDSVGRVFRARESFSRERTTAQDDLKELRRYKEACREQKPEEVKGAYSLLDSLRTRINAEVQFQKDRWKKEFSATATLGDLLEKLLNEGRALALSGQTGAERAERYLSIIADALMESEIGKKQSREHWRRHYESGTTATNVLKNVIVNYAQENLRLHSQVKTQEAIDNDRKAVSSAIRDEVKSYLSQQTQSLGAALEKRWEDSLDKYLPRLEKLETIVNLIDPQEQGSLFSHLEELKEALKPLRDLSRTISQTLTTHREDINAKIGQKLTNLQSALENTIGGKLDSYLVAHQDLIARIGGAIGSLDEAVRSLGEMPEIIRGAINTYFTRGVSASPSGSAEGGSEGDTAGKVMGRLDSSGGNVGKIVLSKVKPTGGAYPRGQKND